MTRHIPEGDSLRPLKGIIIDLGNAAQVPDIYPTQADRNRMFERFHDSLTTAKPRPVAPHPVPWLVPFLAGAAAMALCVALAAFAVDAVQTGAAAQIKAEEYARW